MPSSFLDAGGDGSCDTRPTTYPADGEAVPDGAACALLVDAASTVVGEVWSWADSDSVQWYSYVADAIGEPPIGGSVVMCGSGDAGQEGVSYACSPESTYLLFTVDGVFVEWPTALDAPLHFCQLTLFGGSSTGVPGRACGTVSPPSGETPPPDDGGSAGASPRPSPSPTEPPASPDPEPSPTPSPTVPSDDSSTGPTTSAPDVPAATTDAPQQEPSPPTDAGSPADPVTPVIPSPATPESSVAATPAPPAAADPDDGSGAIDSESVARVGGSPVPMGFVLALAGGLALGGYLMLAGPGFLAARRERR